MKKSQRENKAIFRLRTVAILLFIVYDTMNICKIITFKYSRSIYLIYFIFGFIANCNINRRFGNNIEKEKIIHQSKD